MQTFGITPQVPWRNVADRSAIVAFRSAERTTTIKTPTLGLSFDKSLVLIALLLWVVGPAGAVERPGAPVPPSLEIVVLDPGVDTMGNPAVMVRPKTDGDDSEAESDGEQVIDIPPTVLVHRYYYTGDRSFQAQLLPGGPSVVVVNHPKTGERCYIPVQMLPGAPRVTYTSHLIEYDFGQNAITISFGLFGRPKVKFRSGVPWARRAKTLIHADQVEQKTKNLLAHSTESLQRTGNVVYGAAVIVTEQADQIVITPTKQLLGVLPVVGPVLFSGDLAQQLENRAAQHKRESQQKRAAKEAQRDEGTYSTIR